MNKDLMNEYKKQSTSLLSIAESTRSEIAESKEPEFKVSATVETTDEQEDGGWDPTITRDFRDSEGTLYYRSSLYISYQSKKGVVSISPETKEFKLKDFKKGKTLKFKSESGFIWTFKFK
jgi:hypothetical protein